MQVGYIGKSETKRLQYEAFPEEIKEKLSGNRWKRMERNVFVVADHSTKTTELVSFGKEPPNYTPEQVMQAMIDAFEEDGDLEYGD